MGFLSAKEREEVASETKRNRLKHLSAIKGRVSVSSVNIEWHEVL